MDVELIIQLLENRRNDIEYDLDSYSKATWPLTTGAVMFQEFLRVELARCNAELARHIPTWYSIPEDALGYAFASTIGDPEYDDLT